MKRRIALTLLIILMLLSASCTKAPSSTVGPANVTPSSTTLPGGNQTAPQPSAHPGVGDPAPDLVLTDMTGKTVSLSDYKGQIVWLNFWATW